MKINIWGNTIVKNEGRYLWFAVKSVIDYLDKIIIWDTGSTDTTVEVIELLKKEYPTKIIFQEIGSVDACGLTIARQDMLNQTKGDWFLLLDGDEVWPEDSIKNIIDEISINDENLYGIFVPTFNLVGDIYHYQDEAAGRYKVLGRTGHFNLRAINKNIPGLHIKNDYPLEGYFDGSETLIQDKDDKIKLLDTSILHFSHLERSTLIKRDDKTLHRNKIKYELGNRFESGFKYPKVFYLDRPAIVPDPWVKRRFRYTIRAAIETALKNTKRKLKNKYYYIMRENPLVAR